MKRSVVLAATFFFALSCVESTQDNIPKIGVVKTTPKLVMTGGGGLANDPQEFTFSTVVDTIGGNAIASFKLTTRFMKDLTPEDSLKIPNPGDTVFWLHRWSRIEVVGKTSRD